MSAREHFFTCRFTTASSRRTAHVRAWDGQEAAQLFQIELAEDEVQAREPGTIEVFEAHRQLFSKRYEPAQRGVPSSSAATL